MPSHLFSTLAMDLGPLAGGLLFPDDDGPPFISRVSLPVFEFAIAGRSAMTPNDYSFTPKCPHEALPK